MVFNQFLKRFSFFTTDKNKKPKRPLLNPSKDESARLNLEKANKLIASNKYKKALELINASLSEGVTSNQLLFKKAFLLSHNNHHGRAQEIWEQLSNLPNKPKLAASARELLEKSRKLQEEALNNKKVLIACLHAKAVQFQWNLRSIPQQEEFSPQANIVELVRTEAELAREAELPKLSIDLIDQVIKSGESSPWLKLDKALSLSMMGQQEKAIGLLEGVQKELKNPEIVAIIKKTIVKLSEPQKNKKITISTCMTKQARRLAKANQLKILFLAKPKDINRDTDIKLLILKEAKAALQSNPKATHDLSDTILNYYPKNQPAKQLKGEALASLGFLDKAIETWSELFSSENEDIAKRSSKSATKILARQAKSVCTQKSPKDAINFFIERHLEHKLTPIFDPELTDILRKLEPSSEDLLYPELETHQLQLLFNTLLIDRIESQLREQGLLKIAAPTQKQGAVSETLSKAG